MVVTGRPFPARRRAPVAPVAHLLAAIAFALPATAATWVVDVGGTGDFTAIQPALTAASEDDIVLVLPGTYTGADNRNLSFGTKNLVLRSRDGAATTIIDCQNTSGTRGIVFYNGGQDTTCVVDGFTIKRARLTEAGASGAGIRVEGLTTPPSPLLVNLIVRDNNNIASNGGGLYCNNGVAPVVRNVVFQNNHAQSGGGMYCNNNCAPHLSGVTFVENDAVTRGGGAYCGQGCDAWFMDVLFEENEAGDNGAGLACWKSSPALLRCVFVDNEATDYAGAMDFQTNCSPHIASCTLVGNGAPAGGAIYATGASYPTLTQSIVAFHGAGSSTFHCDGTSLPTVAYSVVFGNAAGDSLCGDHHDNAFVDPLFCNVLTGDLTLASDSPCLPGNPGNPADALVGALGQGCEDSPVEPSSWGRIKCLFR